MNANWPALVQDVVDAMTGGEVTRARDGLVALAPAERPDAGGDAPPLSSLWEPFLRLLHRRGYFVGSPQALRGALEEIREMGEGFDLYDLAAALARCDAVQALRLQVPGSRVFGELRPFVPDLR